jgi:glycosyltransferase involved in cell wall biosynthesis
MWAFFEQSDVNHVTGDVHFLTLGLSKRKTILTVHDCVSLHRLTGLKQALFRFFWYTLPVRKANVITVISEFTKQELLQYVDCAPEAVRVIPDPVSTDFYYVRKPFNDITPRILQIGTKTNKNLTRVVQAVEGITCHLRIIGHLSNQQKLVLERANITYSAIADIPDEQVVKEYRDSDLVVFASTYEGFGLPIVEAQATGRPVITSNIPPMTEVAGDAACLIDPRSVNSIRAGIQKVIKDVAYRESLVRKGIENVKRFSPEQIAKQYADLYREVYRGE